MCIETKNNAVVAREEKGGRDTNPAFSQAQKQAVHRHCLEKSVKIITAQMIHALIVGNLLPLAFQ